MIIHYQPAGCRRPLPHQMATSTPQFWYTSVSNMRAGSPRFFLYFNISRRDLVFKMAASTLTDAVFSHIVSMALLPDLDSCRPAVPTPGQPRNHPAGSLQGYPCGPEGSFQVLHACDPFELCTDQPEGSCQVLPCR